MVNIVGASFTKVTAASFIEKEISIDIAGFPIGVYFVKVNGVYGGRFVKE